MRMLKPEGLKTKFKWDSNPVHNGAQTPPTLNVVKGVPATFDFSQFQVSQIVRSFPTFEFCGTKVQGGVIISRNKIWLLTLPLKLSKK